MDCRLGSQQRGSLVEQVVAYAQAMAERLCTEVMDTEPKLDVMEKAVLAELHGFGNELLSGLVSLCAPAYPAASVACGCGEQAQYRRQRRGQCNSLLGTIQFKRPYYLCPHCHQGGCPLDEQLGFCAGSISAGLDELLALLGCQFSFAHSVEMVRRLTLVEVSPNRCRKSTQALGQRVAEDEEAVRQQTWEQPHLSLPPVDKKMLDPLYISGDGVMVHTRETGWREHCVGAVYTAASVPAHSDQIRSQEMSYLAELGSRSKFGQHLWLEAHRRGLQHANTTIFIGDGAPWLWEMALDLFPQAIQILDWYHATTYLWAVARELHPKDERAAQQWINPHLAQLAQSQTLSLLQQLQQLAASSPAACRAITYFTHNLARMDYARYRQLNLQIGSGTIESACKQVIEARLKQAGMRWTLGNAHAVGKLRARLKSCRWPETLALRHPPHRRYQRRLSPT